MIERVVRIDEDVDFGCEERMDNSPVMAIVTLQDEDGLEHQIRVADQSLYDSDISEGDRIFLDADGRIHKVV
ncbi:MAG: hypothetical protein ACI4FX_10105 [Agathobacter sp.]